MATLLGTPGAQPKTQVSTSEPVRELEFGIKQFSDSADDDRVSLVHHAPQTQEPLDLDEFEYGSNLYNDEDHDLDNEEGEYDDDDDDDLEMKLRMIRRWYTNLPQILLALSFLCYPVMLRALEVITTILSSYPVMLYALEVITTVLLKKHVLDTGVTLDDLQLVLKAYTTLGVVLAMFVSVAYNPRRFRGQIWILAVDL